MQRQINNYIANHLSPHLCGYRKDYNTHQHLVSGIERWQNILDDKGFRGAVLMHLSKAFNALNHELPIAKLQAYGFNRDLLYSPVQQMANDGFSSWALIQGVPQRYVLGPLLLTFT